MEIVDFVDKNDRVLGQVTRKEIHLKNYIYRGVHIFVLDLKNRVWIERRGKNVEIKPGYLSSSAAGHVKSGESYEHAAKREVREELGFRNIKLERIAKFNPSNLTFNGFVVFFIGRTDKKAVKHAKASELLLLTKKQVENRIKKGEFAPLPKHLYFLCKKLNKF